MSDLEKRVRERAHGFTVSGSDLEHFLLGVADEIKHEAERTAALGRQMRLAIFRAAEQAERIATLEALLREASDAMQYHTEMTRPIERTREVLARIDAALSGKG